jgi:peptidoglycan/xylan/chitin deacetylase (PgdA/CDA1 family)
MIYFTTSWDDGSKFDMKIANMLLDYGYKGTFYIPVNYEKRTLGDSQIKKISRNFEIGSHGFSHRILTKLNEEESKKELFFSKTALEKLVKKPVVSYAYPFGNFNSSTISKVKKAGFKFARTSQEFSSQVKNPFAAEITLRASNNPSKFLHPQIWRLLIKSKFKWNELAKSIFRNCRRNSIFHLTGHSYNLSNENFEQELIDFFDYVKKFRSISITNSQILKIGSE